MPDVLIAFIAGGGFLVGFPILWMTVLFFVSRIGGWAGLATQFSTNDAPSGERFSWSSAHLNWFARYGNTINVTVSSQGIHLQPVIIFRFGHRPIFIPWRAISSMSRSKIFGFSWTKLVVDGHTGRRDWQIALYGNSLADCLQRHAPGHIKV